MTAIEQLKSILSKGTSTEPSGRLTLNSDEMREVFRLSALEIAKGSSIAIRYVLEELGIVHENWQATVEENPEAISSILANRRVAEALTPIIFRDLIPTYEKNFFSFEEFNDRYLKFQDPEYKKNFCTSIFKHLILGIDSQEEALHASHYYECLLKICKESDISFLPNEAYIATQRIFTKKLRIRSELAKKIALSLPEHVLKNKDFQTELHKWFGKEIVRFIKFLNDFKARAIKSSKNLEDSFSVLSKDFSKELEFFEAALSFYNDASRYFPQKIKYNPFFRTAVNKLFITSKNFNLHSAINSTLCYEIIQSAENLENRNDGFHLLYTNESHLPMLIASCVLDTVKGGELHNLPGLLSMLPREYHNANQLTEDIREKLEKNSHKYEIGMRTWLESKTFELKRSNSNLSDPHFKSLFEEVGYIKSYYLAMVDSSKPLYKDTISACSQFIETLLKKGVGGVIIALKFASSFSYRFKQEIFDESKIELEKAREKITIKIKAIREKHNERNIIPEAQVIEEYLANVSIANKIGELLKLKKISSEIPKPWKKKLAVAYFFDEFELEQHQPTTAKHYAIFKARNLRNLDNFLDVEYTANIQRLSPINRAKELLHLLNNKGLDFDAQEIFALTAFKITLRLGNKEQILETKKVVERWARKNNLKELARNLRSYGIMINKEPNRRLEDTGLDKFSLLRNWLENYTLAA